ncbi:Serine/threonine-protein kinase 11-interacting protein [Camelus dromedarius]|uniref:Serine/threonine-protein kinase 11-interacting protein n=1 Tax=Camelus dromedarius TaxID=9838 RepID=A0A5N4E4R7_CAMDR|nr:Serine/threonine-protein kinase 11-interacting protein [Camelus dromedarius]
MGPSGAALGTLILRGNELQSLHGLEQLRNLRHLDVAYNLLEGHRELSPLWLLAELRKLYLEGNPLWFHPAHRAATAQYLSPRARDAATGFLLDGKALSLTDFQASTSSGLGPPALPLPWLVGSTTETSGGPDLSDSPSSGGVVAQPPVRKVKSRVRVRRASISEPSDTDPEPRTLDPSPAGWFVQQHRELELMNSFRERFGCDWLQYRNHLEASGTPVLATSKTPALSTLPLDVPSPETVPGSLPPERESPEEVAEEVRVEPELLEEEEEEVVEEQGKEEGGKEEEEEEEEQEHNEMEGECSVTTGEAGTRCWWRVWEVELCRPMLVCPLEGPGGVRGRECFLWVTSGHLFEVELQAARTLERLELQSLEAADIETETQTQREAAPEQGSDPCPRGPILVLRFSYICRDRQLRRYVVLEPDAQAAIQELLAVLTPAATSAQQQLGGTRDPPEGRLQCLRCGHEFKAEEPRQGLDSEEGWRPLFQKTASERCGLRSVDHRLRLFLDVEVFTDAQEEFQCCLKVCASLALLCAPK